jgi:hypothetical protein
MLFHVSEEAGITRFDPRKAPGVARPVVWAVDEEKLRNYLLPRDCPRVTFFAQSDSSAADVERFLGSSHSVVAIESAWLERVRRARLFCYRLPDATFKCIDSCAGYFHSDEAVIPEKVEVINDLLNALSSRGIELRILRSLWPLHDAIAGSTLGFSMIRMRNASPQGCGG